MGGLEEPVERVPRVLEPAFVDFALELAPEFRHLPGPAQGLVQIRVEVLAHGPAGGKPVIQTDEVEEGKEFLSNYRSGLYGYTYLE